MRFSRAQQGKLNLGTARAEDKAATSTALYNIGIQDAADKAIYKIFGEELKRETERVQREFKKRTGLADTFAKAAGTVLPAAVDFIAPGVGTAGRALLATAGKEGVRFAAGGYEGARDDRLKSLSMPKTLFRTKSVGAQLEKNQEAILEGFEDIEDARKTNLAIGAVLDTITTGIESKSFMDRKIEGSPLTNRELLMAEGEGRDKIGLGDYLSTRFTANVPNEKFFEFSLDQFNIKNPTASQEEKNTFLRKIYDLYPDLAMERGYDPFKDAASIYGQGEGG
tara:strand:- start:4705 stop:5547 length:843 start_codon:yes stop_codon:yes gene_type:complete